MQKLIKFDLTPSEYLPIKELINSYPYPDTTVSTKIQITTYLAAIALMRGLCLVQDMSHPKELLYFKTELDFKKTKYKYTAIIGIEIQENKSQEDA